MSNNEREVMRLQSEPAEVPPPATGADVAKTWLFLAVITAIAIAIGVVFT